MGRGRNIFLGMALALLMLFLPVRAGQECRAAAAAAGAAGAVVGILSELLGAAKDVEELTKILALVDSVNSVAQKWGDRLEKGANAIQNAMALVQCTQQFKYCTEETYSLFKDICDYPAYAAANFGTDYKSSMKVARQGIGYAKDITAELVGLKGIIEALKGGDIDPMVARSKLSQMANIVSRARTLWSDMVYKDLGFRSPDEAKAMKRANSAAQLYADNGFFNPLNRITDSANESAKYNKVNLPTGETMEEFLRRTERKKNFGEVDEKMIQNQQRKLVEVFTGPAMHIATLLVGLIGAICCVWQLLRYFNDSVEMGRDINPLVNTFGKVGLGMVLFSIAMAAIRAFIGRQI